MRTYAGLCVTSMVALLAGTSMGWAQPPEARGQAVYAEQRCALCHSVAGEGNSKGPLDGVGSRLSVEDIRLWVVDPKTITAATGADRKPPMRAYPSLPAEDLDALVAYMVSLKTE
jgi:mono/diheme cytochrome c family protein